MLESIGERRQRIARRKRQLVVAVLALCAATTAAVWVFSIDPEKSPRPIDIVQGTGGEMDKFTVRFVGPDGLRLRLDQITGKSWSISWVAGWIRNASPNTVRFDRIRYAVRDEANRILWEVEDPRFPSGFTLDPIDYITFDVMPVCSGRGTAFDVIVEGAEVIEK